MGRKERAEAQRAYTDRLREAGYQLRSVWVHADDLADWEEIRKNFANRLAARSSTPSDATSTRS